jgi:hypothetical protein
MRIVRLLGLAVLVCGCRPTPSDNGTPGVESSATSLVATVRPTTLAMTAPATIAATPQATSEATRIATSAPTAATTRAATSAPTAAATVAPTRGPTAGGSISGTITTFSIRGDVPSANTTVELRPEVPTDPSDPPRASTRTNISGQYMLERVDNGRYLLTAGDGGVGSPQANVTIAGADLVLDLRLEPVATALVFTLLSGRVVDASNRPVGNASVWLTGGNCHATTASDGTYTMAVIHDTASQRILNATTSAQSGFVLVTNAQAQPTIQLSRPALSGAPSDICPTTIGLLGPTPTPAPGRVVTVLRTVVIPRITVSVVTRP